MMHDHAQQHCSVTHTACAPTSHKGGNTVHHMLSTTCSAPVQGTLNMPAESPKHAVHGPPSVEPVLAAAEVGMGRVSTMDRRLPFSSYYLY